MMINDDGDGTIISTPNHTSAHVHEENGSSILLGGIAVHIVMWIMTNNNNNNCLDRCCRIHKRNVYDKLDDGDDDDDDGGGDDNGKNNHYHDDSSHFDPFHCDDEGMQ